MQLSAPATASTPIDLRPPHSARPGMPMTQTVMLTAAPTNTPFPAAGFGLTGSLLRFGSAIEDARRAARSFATATGSAYAVVAYARHVNDQPSYGVAQLAKLEWQQQGYGGHFRESHAQLADTSKLHAISKNGATVLAVFAASRELTVTRSW